MLCRCLICLKYTLSNSAFEDVIRDCVIWRLKRMLNPWIFTCGVVDLWISVTNKQVKLTESSMLSHLYLSAGKIYNE